MKSRFVPIRWVPPLTFPGKSNTSTSTALRTRLIQYRTRTVDGIVVRPDSRVVLLSALRGRSIDVISKRHTITLRVRFSKLAGAKGGKLAAYRLTQQKIGPGHWILRVLPKTAKVEPLPCEPGYPPDKARLTDAVNQLLAGRFVDLPTRADTLKLQAAFRRVPKERRKRLRTLSTRVHGGYRIRVVERQAKPVQETKAPNPYAPGDRWLRQIATELMAQRWADQLRRHAGAAT